MGPCQRTSNPFSGGSSFALPFPFFALGTAPGILSSWASSRMYTAPVAGLRTCDAACSPLGPT